MQPLANYNVIVLDQRFRKNSSVSFVNTNVTRDGHFRDANVSAAIFDLNTKENTYNLSGNYKYSYINETGAAENKKGFSSSLGVAETNGKYRYSMGADYVSRDYDNNDLGINFITHFHALYANGSYRILNPTKHFNSFQISPNIYSEFDNRTDRLQEFGLNLSFDMANKKNDNYGFNFNINPFKTSNFYEPRSPDQSNFLIVPDYYNVSGYISSNYNRKFAIDLNPFYTYVNEKLRRNYGIAVSPRYRFSDKFALIYNFNFSRKNNNIGWIAFEDNGNTVLARRNLITYTNGLQGKYSISNKMNINLDVRHYWSYAINNDCLTLQQDGSYIDNPTYNENKNSNFTNWNVDLSYSWWFAPGSQLTVLYRNNSALFSRDFSREFGRNFSRSIDNENLDHVFSISMRYFIDYNSFKKK